MLNFTPLKVHSHYSLLKGLSKPVQIAKRCKQLNYNTCALTDDGISGSISFMKAMKDVCVCGEQKGEHKNGGKGECRHKNGCKEFRASPIKPIIGCQFYLCDKSPEIKDETNCGEKGLYVLAKNHDGWKKLIQVVSLSNEPKNFFKKPRLQLEQFSEFTKQESLIAMNGHIGSDLADAIFTNPFLAYSSENYEIAKSFVDENWKSKLISLIGKYQEIFGKKNFFLEVELINSLTVPASVIVSKALRYIAKKTDCECVAVASSYYPDKIDSRDQRLLLCSKMETTFKSVNSELRKEENYDLSFFFKSSNYGIPSIEEVTSTYEESEIINTEKIAEMVEKYDVFGPPILPKFQCPNDASPDEYLRELCIKGWKEKILPNVPKERLTEYSERIKKELGVFKEAGLASYFLIVQDYCRHAREDLGLLLGCGRGSGAGSLVSMLIGITSENVDPIENDLYFERFYNAGRNSPGRISLPDIDCDFPITRRDDVKLYVKNKYGADKFAEMLTYNRIQGRGALKEVFRIHDACSFEEMNLISKNIVDESKIADDLQEMREEFGESSIIRWALENTPAKLKQWCFINKDDGTLDGPYSKLFEQAIRLEGTKKSQGKHPSGIIIASDVLSKICPMVYDKHGDSVIAGWEMGDLEAIGLPKFDILGIAVLDKLMGVQKLLLDGELDD